MRIAQLNEEDKNTISKKRIQDSVKIAFTLLFLIVSIGFTYYDKYQKIEFTSQLITDSGASIFLAGMALLILCFSILNMRHVTADLQGGTKEIFTGSITKRKDDKNKSKGYFIIDNEDFRVPRNIYDQFEENEILSIERSPKAHYFLNAYRANTPQK